MRSSSFPARFWGHLKTITLHKLRVTRLCFKMGLIKQGLLHDLSKYSPVEFWAGVRYFQGYRSPIDAEKEAKGYSEGWLHHKGHNKHHWEYWLDNAADGIQPLEMPLNYVIEMYCRGDGLRPDRSVSDVSEREVHKRFADRVFPSGQRQAVHASAYRSAASAVFGMG